MPIDEEAVKAKLKAAFDAVDEDGDGVISAGDLKTVLENAGLHPTDDQVERVIAAADQDGSGNLAFEEFAAAVIKVAIVLFIGAKLKQLFDELDADGSGYITSDDLKALVDNAGYSDEVSPEAIDELVGKCDADGDGKISFQDFLGALKNYFENQ